MVGPPCSHEFNGMTMSLEPYHTIPIQSNPIQSYHIILTQRDFADYANTPSGASPRYACCVSTPNSCKLKSIIPIRYTFARVSRSLLAAAYGGHRQTQPLLLRQHNMRDSALTQTQAQEPNLRSGVPTPTSCKGFGLLHE